MSDASQLGAFLSNFGITGAVFPKKVLYTMKVIISFYKLKYHMFI